MSKKIDNKVLLIILISLIAVFIIARFIKTGKTEKSFKTDLVLIDTSQVSEILLYPQTENLEEIRISHLEGGWIVQKGDVSAPGGKTSIQNLLSQLLQVKPKRLAARTKDKWEEYQLTDSLATRIRIIEAKGKETLDLLIGKFTYQQSNNPYEQYGGRGNIVGTSYVRLADEDEIYTVNGFLTMSMNREFSYWRNQEIINTRKVDLTKLVFHYPADSGFIALKKDTVWSIGSLEADSLKIERYLNSLSSKSHSVYIDDFTPPSIPDYQLTIEGNNMSPLVIQAFRKSENEYVINSSINPKSYFVSDFSDLFSALFKGMQDFLAE